MIVLLALAACLRPLPAPDEAAPPQPFDARCLRGQDGPCTVSGTLPSAAGRLRVVVTGACPSVLVELHGTEPVPTESVFARVRAVTEASAGASRGEALRRGDVPPPPQGSPSVVHPAEAQLPWPEGLERARLRWGCDAERGLDAPDLVSLEVARSVVDGDVLVLSLPAPSATAALVAPPLRDIAPPAPVGVPGPVPRGTPGMPPPPDAPPAPVPPSR